ncbi:MAG TPA: Holliday junction branch migration protein RuvA, partial [Planctomycetota bacterium]|nr:Holliday junction branch migration protein RuvA [Planctomycetota bacterium]
MYDFIRGRLSQRGPDEVVLDVGGLGYELAVSGATAGRLPAAGSEVTLFVHDRLKDERLVLYGFASREERQLFLKLLTVSRIGPGIALSLLSALEPGPLVAAVDGGDVATLSRVRGVGRRTAERLCVELKGRLDGLPALPGRLTD